MLGIRWELANPSPAPPANSFSYAFDHLAEIIEQFTDEIGLTRHSRCRTTAGPLACAWRCADPNG